MHSSSSTKYLLLQNFFRIHFDTFVLTDILLKTCFDNPFSDVKIYI